MHVVGIRGQFSGDAPERYTIRFKVTPGEAESRVDPVW
jgi:hypothetical protein